MKYSVEYDDGGMPFIANNLDRLDYCEMIEIAVILNLHHEKQRRKNLKVGEILRKNLDEHKLNFESKK